MFWSWSLSLWLACIYFEPLHFLILDHIIHDCIKMFHSCFPCLSFEFGTIRIIVCIYARTYLYPWLCSRLFTYTYSMWNYSYTWPLEQNIHICSFAHMFRKHVIQTEPIKKHFLKLKKLRERDTFLEKIRESQTFHWEWSRNIKAWNSKFFSLHLWLQNIYGEYKYVLSLASKWEGVYW